MSSSPSATTVAAAAAAAAAAGTGTDAGATEPVTTDQPASPAPGSATPPSENVDPLVAPYGVDRLGRPRRRPPIITYEQMASYTPADREAAHARSSLLTTLMKRHGRCAACLWPTQCSTDEPGSYRPPGSDPSVQWTDPLTKIPLYQPFPRPGLPEQTTGPVLRAPANGACNCASIGPAISQLGVGPQGDGKHRIALYMHSKEWSRSSNTGKIIANLCPGALVACHAVSPSERRIYRATMAALRAGRQPFILFPTPDSQPLEDFLAAHPVTAQPLPLSDPTELAFVSAGFDDGGEADEAGGVPGEPAINRILRGLGEYQSFEHCADAAILDRWSWPEADVPVPVTGPVRGYFIIVIDGTWGQAKTIQRHLPLWIPRVHISPDSPSLFVLRSQTQSDRISTIEAFAAMARQLINHLECDPATESDSTTAAAAGGIPNTPGDRVMRHLLRTLTIHQDTALAGRLTDRHMYGPNKPARPPKKRPCPSEAQANASAASDEAAPLATVPDEPAMSLGEEAAGAPARKVPHCEDAPSGTTQ